ncbi:thiol-disulfide oxidoreductase DCC family protein [Streptomyces levis]|uniref:thiol-disulfide oxidoreductase DCC family protein n=1 Tax=Streptomyces levis TaxID=285566 RepID=UPI003C7D900B
MRTRPVLIFDGDCGFCTMSVGVVQRLVRPRCEVVAWQQADLTSLGVTEERARYEALWVTPTGRVYGGAQAVAKILLSGGGVWAVAGALLTLPPVRWAAHGVYRLVADNRARLPGGAGACASTGAKGGGWGSGTWLPSAGAPGRSAPRDGTTWYAG